MIQYIIVSFSKISIKKAPICSLIKQIIVKGRESNEHYTKVYKQTEKGLEVFLDTFYKYNSYNCYGTLRFRSVK